MELRLRLLDDPELDGRLLSTGDDVTSEILSGGDGSGLGSSDMLNARPTPAVGGKMGVMGWAEGMSSSVPWECCGVGEMYD